MTLRRNGFYVDISKIRFKVWPVKNYSLIICGKTSHNFIFNDPQAPPTKLMVVDLKKCISNFFFLFVGILEERV